MGLEGWMERLVASSGYKGQVIIASNGITPLIVHDDDHHHGHSDTDFHAWQDAKNGVQYIANIRDALIAADPAHSSGYKTRADKATRELNALDQWIKSQIATLDINKRKLITTHNAFGYYQHAYGVTFIAPRGVNTESEPSAGDMARLIDQLRAQHVKAVFLENIADDRLVHQLEADTGAHIGGTLYSDALSLPDGPAGSYVAMLRHNTLQMLSGMQHNY
jgi:zinc/manganese transport system substrate-binding protein